MRHQDSIEAGNAPRELRGQLAFVRERVEATQSGKWAGRSFRRDIRDASDPLCIHVRGLLARRLHDLDAQIADLFSLRETVAKLHA